MKKKKLLTLLLSLVLVASLTVFTGCGAKDEEEAIPAPAPEPELTNVEKLMQDMTLREKVGQLFIVRPESLAGSSVAVTTLSEQMKESLKEYPVGGVILFAQNITTPDQIKTFNADLKAASEIPLFISVDEEGGIVARLANNAAFGLTKYKSAAAVAASGDTEDALQMGKVIGSYLSEYGFNMDFAPDADVNTNPNNPVIGTRAFSSDPLIAADMAAAMASGLHQNNIIPVFKHFPGHGDTAEDSHVGVAVSKKTREEMRSCEWLPFMKAGDNDGVMVGHITTPNATEDSLPATLSSEMVTGVLRNELNFSGLIITDALEMGAIVNQYGAADAAVMAFKAGCDVLLLPGNVQEAFNAVIAAVENGDISEERLDESVERILQFKDNYGLIDWDKLLP